MLSPGGDSSAPIEDMYVYVCLYVCMYVCMYTLMSGGPIGYWYFINVCMYIYLRMHECMYIYMYVYVCENI